jgi:hypothetical protein
MRVLTDIGHRVELVPMDPHLSDISIGLYCKETTDGPLGIVHSYSGIGGVDERIGFVAKAMTVLGGMERIADGDGTVRFPCRTWHGAAAKRLFLEACKHNPTAPLAPRPLEVPDTRSEQVIQIESLGDGAYMVHAKGATEETPSRAPAIAAALAKLTELSLSDDALVVSFPCGHEHDSLIALMLLRAQNLRAVLREEEMKASRGVLAAPSAQE